MLIQIKIKQAINKKIVRKRMEDDYDEVVGNAGLPQLHKFPIIRKVST